MDITITSLNFYTFHLKAKVAGAKLVVKMSGYDFTRQFVPYTVGVAKIFRFTCTLFWSILTYSRTHARSFSEK